jgi:hypothetical protein
MRQRSTRRSPPSKYDDAVISAEQSADREIQLEQELAVTSEVRTFLPPIPLARRMELVKSKVQNFVHFSRHKAKVAKGEGLDKNTPLSLRIAAVGRESTVVDLS